MCVVCGVVKKDSVCCLYVVVEWINACTQAVYVMLKGPHGLVPVTPVLHSFEFSSDKPEAPYKWVVWWLDGGVVVGWWCGGRMVVWWQDGGVVAG